jgi:hypothetical protein
MFGRSNARRNFTRRRCHDGEMPFDVGSLTLICAMEKIGHQAASNGLLASCPGPSFPRRVGALTVAQDGANLHTDGGGLYASNFGCVRTWALALQGRMASRRN